MYVVFQCGLIIKVVSYSIALGIYQTPSLFIHSRLDAHEKYASVTVCLADPITT